MKMLAAVAFVVAFAPSASLAADFGTKDDARALATELIDIVEREGVAAAAAAVSDPGGPFHPSRMGIHLFQGSIVLADNREPESLAADYSAFTDVTGAPIWSKISAAADKEDEAILTWYHYDTQEVYEYQCLCKRAALHDAIVMICR